MARPQDDLVISIKLASGGTVYVNVTADVKSVSWSRGRERSTDDFQPGHGRLVLRDIDRRYDPTNTAGPYYGGISPNRPLKIVWDGNSLFTGFAHSWSIDYARGDTIAYVTVDFYDAFGIFAGIDLDEITPASFANDTSGVRIDRVLALTDASTFLTGDNVDAGLSVLGATTYGENSLSYMQRVATAEAGYMFIDMAGVFQFLDRHTVLNVTAGSTFTDQLNTPGTIPYETVTQTSNTELLFNQVTGSSATTGTEQSVGDATARAFYYLSVLPLGELFNLTDVDVLNMLQWYLQRFRAPEVRFNSLGMQINALSPTQVDTVLTTELSTVVTVERTPLGTGSTISKMCIVEAVAHDISNDSWRVTFQLANADTRTFLVLDDPIFGELDVYRAAF